MADSVTFRFSGGDEFILDLERWRDRLREDVHLAARTEAGLIASMVRSMFPIRTTNLRRTRNSEPSWAPPGELRRRVQVDNISGGLEAIRFATRSTAPHSHLLERGTVPRSYTSKHGKPHFTGSVTGRPLFVPVAILRRSEFKDKVRRILGSPEPSLGSGNPTVTGSL